MSDETLDILIRSKADTSGYQETDKSLNKLKQSHQEAGNETEKHTLSAHKLHKVFHALNEIMPGMGTLASAAFSPIGAAISLSVMALHRFHEKIKETNEEFKRFEEEAAKPATRRLEAMRGAIVDTASGLVALTDRLREAARGEQTLKEQTEKATAASHEQFEQARALGDALKENEMAQLELAHDNGLLSEQSYADKKLQIEIDYLKRKRQLDENEEKTEILMRNRALELAQTEQAGLASKADGSEMAREKALTALASLRPREDINKDRDLTAAKLKEFETKHAQNSEWFAGFGVGQDPAKVVQALMQRENLSQHGAAGMSKQYEEWSKLQIAATGAQREWEQAPGAEAKRRVAADHATREAERDARRAEENQSFITDTGRDLTMRRGRFDERHKSNLEREGLDTERLKLQSLKTPMGLAALGDIKEGVDIANQVQQNKRVSQESKQRLIDIVSAEQGHAVSLGEAVRALAGTQKSMGEFTNHVLRLVESMRGITKATSMMDGKISSIEKEVLALKARQVGQFMP